MIDAAGWVGRTALVTGASRGIGRAVAVHLAGRGARLALLARDAAALREVAEACQQAGPGEVGTWTLDLTDGDAVEATLPAVLRSLDDRLDLLANVAGASLRAARLEQLTDRDWRDGLELNLLAAVRLQRLCFAALAEASGAVVNVGSVVAGRAAVLGGPYAAAKAALASLTRSTAVEWARHGIRATTVEPGYVATDFNAGLVAAGLEERLLDKVPTRRAIDPEDVARLVAFAGAPAQAQLTGATLRLDGGMTAGL